MVLTNPPLVSIITPSYNQAAFLEQTFQSVFAQDYPQIEYLVVDGASSDESPKIIQNYSDRLGWWISEKDSGQADAINKGFRRANGEIIGWLNSDDFYLPGSVSQAVSVLQSNPRLGLVYADAITVDVNGIPINRLSFGDWGLADLMSFKIICQPAVFMRRSVLEKAGYLDQSYHFLLDHHLWLRMARLAPIQHISSLWAAARHHLQAKNVSQAGFFGDEAMRILNWMRNDPFYRNQFEENEAHIFGGAYRLQARYLLDGDQPGQALRSYFQAFRYWPEFTLQHSHRISYAILSLLKANWVIDKLREKKAIGQRNQLIHELEKELNFTDSVQNQGKSISSWPGIKLDLI